MRILFLFLFALAMSIFATKYVVAKESQGVIEQLKRENLIREAHDLELQIGIINSKLSSLHAQIKNIEDGGKSLVTKHADIYKQLGIDYAKGDRASPDGTIAHVAVQAPPAPTQAPKKAEPETTLQTAVPHPPLKK